MLPAHCRPPGNQLSPKAALCLYKLSRYMPELACLQSLVAGEVEDRRAREPDGSWDFVTSKDLRAVLERVVGFARKKKAAGEKAKTARDAGGEGAVGDEEAIPAQYSGLNLEALFEDAENGMWDEGEGEGEGGAEGERSAGAAGSVSRDVAGRIVDEEYDD
ncbi:hypothetical protein MBLNU230_g1019t1 [Neophaeotheca triangularis]